jgi:antitoxin (DNA-binding transcriptional repressor) of toxin-antitoxin stability system
MSAQSVGIREFRDKLATYLLTAGKPLAITRHGDTIGFYLPVRRKRTEAQKAALNAAHAHIQQLMAEAGVTEDEIVGEFKRIRKHGRRKERARK